MWGAPETDGCLHEPAEQPVRPATQEERYCNAAFRAEENHYRLSRSIFPLDVLPTAVTDLGPGSLALLLGSQPRFAEDTVWFQPVFEGDPEPEKLPPLRFDPASPWWRTTEEIIRRSAVLARGKYMVGCPDLVENMDMLSSLRGAQRLLIDLIERPEWVERKIWEINDVWFDVYQRIYDLIKLPDGSSAFGAFYIWGPGKVAKVQCDASVMISPSAYRRFVMPALARSAGGSTTRSIILTARRQ